MSSQSACLIHLLYLIEANFILSKRYKILPGVSVEISVCILHQKSDVPLKYKPVNQDCFRKNSDKT